MAAEGLDGIVVTDTVLSDIDGQRGRLVIRGHDVEALVACAGFEHACALLEDGHFPERNRGDAVRARIGLAREAVFARLIDLGDALDRPDGMDALRAGLAHLSPPAGSARAELIAAPAVLAAAWWRRHSGEPPVAPDGTLGHAADFLRMIHGRRGDAARERALDVYLTTVVEHGLNASTFAARVVASTGSDDVSAIVAAVGALKGPLHGGAPGPVLDMLDGIGDLEGARTWIEGEVRAGRRIMGLGHRVYRVRDPRAAIFEAEVERLEREGAGSGRLALARAVERAAVEVLRERHPGRRLEANVEFYTALLLDAVGLPRQLFTPTFAVGRVAGWLAHVEEQRRTGRIIRPSSRYVGPLPAEAEGATVLARDAGTG
ncbi:MAG: citrate synthase [Candidatus Binatota bacterium]|nr:citrate synthase [Candidatus Binatota bacterium]